MEESRKTHRPHIKVGKDEGGKEEDCSAQTWVSRANWQRCPTGAGSRRGMVII